MVQLFTIQVTQKLDSLLNPARTVILAFDMLKDVFIEGSAMVLSHVKKLCEPGNAVIKTAHFRSKTNMHIADMHNPNLLRDRYIRKIKPH